MSLTMDLVKSVATVLTVYGIETCQDYFAYFLISWIVATVLTVYGIETQLSFTE